jgi:putative transposase
MITDDKLNDLALFRFSLIAPAINETFAAPSLNQFFRDVAAKTYKLPDGHEVQFAAATIKSWFLGYRKNGFDGLIPKTRCDLGKPRRLDYNAINQIQVLKEKFPYITAKLIYQKLIEDGYLKASRTSLSTVQRYIRDNNLKPQQLKPVPRLAFEMAFANDCWQSDTSHGPVIKINGIKRHTFLISFIDDASRLILHGEFFFNDNAVNMQLVFKKAIAKYGLPKKLFVDNGATYKNDQLQLICASLGCLLIHAKAYSPESKGKIERSFRTIKDNWLNGVDWNDFHSLGELNAGFARYLSENYNNSLHSAINTTPKERYLRDLDKLKFIPPEQLEIYFWHRISRKVNNDATISLNSQLFEVPQKYIGQKINLRYLPSDNSKAYVFDHNNLVDTIYLLNKIDNSKIKRQSIDYSTMNGGNLNV